MFVWLFVLGILLFDVGWLFCLCWQFGYLLCVVVLLVALSLRLLTACLGFTCNCFVGDASCWIALLVAFDEFWFDEFCWLYWLVTGVSWFAFLVIVLISLVLYCWVHRCWLYS